MNYCLGTVQFGLNYGIQENGQPQKDKVFEMLSYAIQNGIDILDTASAYGEAEAVLGDYFRTYPEYAGQTSVVSKLKPDAFIEPDAEKWHETAVWNCEQSIEKLGIKKLYAYLFHNASYIFDERAVEALYAVKEKRLADRIGVSIYTPEEAMKALDYPQIEAIQIPYNLFDRRLDKCSFFEKAKAKGVTVFARSSLLQGLVMMDPEQLPEKVAFARGYLEEFRKICAQAGQSPLNTAIGYVGNKDGIDYVVFGVDNISQLKEYIMMRDEKLPDRMTEMIDETFDQVEERLVNPSLWR